MEGGQLLQTKIGGVPLVALVGVGGGLVALLLAVRGRAKQPTSGADVISPSAAEAFGTLQQGQQDLGNALSALGGGQAEIIKGQTSATYAEGSHYAQLMAGNAYMINPQDPRVQEWEQLSARLGALSTASPAGSVN
jgi:hypothetical protein